MEKEVRAICERYRKGEELIFISKVNSHLLKMGEEFLIYRIEVDDNNVFRNKFYLKSKCDKKSFSVESQELINLFELKHPKDPNELIGRKVKLKIELNINQTINLTDYGFNENVKWVDLTEDEQSQIKEYIRNEHIAYVSLEDID
jgi:hypothetical protein